MIASACSVSQIRARPARSTVAISLPVLAAGFAAQDKLVRAVK